MGGTVAGSTHGRVAQVAKIGLAGARVSPALTNTVVCVPATQKQWIKLLQVAGWTLERGGSHQVKMTKAGHRPVTLPENKRRAYSKRFEAQLRRETGINDRG